MSNPVTNGDSLQDMNPKNVTHEETGDILEMLTCKHPKVKGTPPWEDDRFDVNVMLSNRRKEENRALSVGAHECITEESEDEGHKDGMVSHTQYTVNMHRFAEPSKKKKKKKKKKKGKKSQRSTHPYHDDSSVSTSDDSTSSSDVEP